MSYFHAVAYSPIFDPEDIPAGVQLISMFVPLWVWSVLWFIAALIALASIPKAWPGGSIGCALLCFVYACGYAVSWAITIKGFHMIWYHHIPLFTFINTDVPQQRDYFRSSIYWSILLLLGAGYILSRKALDAAKVLSPTTEH